MSAVEDLSRRRGGREARRALRARPIPMEEAAVRPGMEGGQYKPLSQRDMERIHEAALTLLETVGLGQAIPSCIEAMTARGCFMNAKGRLCIPRALIEDTLANCARDFVLYGRDPKHDMEPSGNKVYFGTAGAAVHIVEPRRAPIASRFSSISTTPPASSTLCEHIHFFQRCAHGARHDHRARSRHQHAVCLHRRHAEACRHQHGGARACRRMPADAALSWRAAKRNGASGPSCRNPTASSCRR